MKITTEQLRKIIKEESALVENPVGDLGDYDPFDLIAYVADMVHELMSSDVCGGLNIALQRLAESDGPEYYDDEINGTDFLRQTVEAVEELQAAYDALTALGWTAQ